MHGNHTTTTMNIASDSPVHTNTTNNELLTSPANP